MNGHFISFYGQITFHCRDRPHLVYSFISWQTFRLFPIFGYYEKCYDEHSCTNGFNMWKLELLIFSYTPIPFLVFPISKNNVCHLMAQNKSLISFFIIILSSNLSFLLPKYISNAFTLLLSHLLSPSQAATISCHSILTSSPSPTLTLLPRDFP